MLGPRSLASAGPRLGIAVARIVGGWPLLDSGAPLRRVLAPMATDRVDPSRGAGGRGAPRSVTARRAGGRPEANGLSAPLSGRPRGRREEWAGRTERTARAAKLRGAGELHRQGLEPPQHGVGLAHGLAGQLEVG